MHDRFVVGRNPQDATNLVHEWQHLISGPAFRLPRVKVRSLSSGIHQPVNSTSAAEGTSRWDDGSTAGELLGLVPSPEQCNLAVREQVPWVQCWVDNFGHAIVIGTLLNDQNLELFVGFSKAASNHTASEAAY